MMTQPLVQQAVQATEPAKILLDKVPVAPSLKELAERSDSHKIAKNKNSRWLTFYTVLAICTGVALSGSAIPFFLNTTIPALMFLSNKIVLSSLTIVQIVVWAAIYGQNNSEFISDSYWREMVKKTPYEPKKADTSSKEKPFSKFRSLINNWFPSSALSQRYLKNEESSWRHEVAKFDDIVKDIVDGNSQHEQPNQIVDAHNQIKLYLTEKYGKFDKIKYLGLILETKRLYQDHIDSPYFEKNSKETFKARKAIIEGILNGYIDKSTFVFDFNSDPKTSAEKSANQLFIANKYLSFIKIVDVFADAIGVINAIFVNAAGVCISAMQLMAFSANIAVKVGILSSPIIPAPIALFVLSLGMLAGWNAAHTVTRMKTREVCREIAFNLMYWWHNENKWKLSNYFNWSKSYSFLASLIAIVLSVGFCCFNAATGAILGDTLYKIFVYHNLSCITNPSIILNPVITPTTWVGKLLWSLGLLLTIPSTGAFLVGIERAWIAGFGNNVRALGAYLKNQIKNEVSYNYYIGIVISAVILPVSYALFNLFGIIPVLPLFQVALASMIMPVLYLISINIDATGFRSVDNIKGILIQSTATLLVLLMTFATAAQITILTSTSPMWLFVLTQPQLNIWAAVTGICGLVGFVYMFNGGLAGTISTKPVDIKSTDVIDEAVKLSSSYSESTFYHIYSPNEHISPTK